ncbi:ATP-grasp domain-containing protein [Planctomycetes bacterium K23_9]|uniref:ATP-grasp domain protein n=1 Tax=Stieleria marina TaxID=1930275 RepID=A0A517NVY2_9BACT|nr:ATP-grasp domain protein [Planctomycetes bacterium K23_9]
MQPPQPPTDPTTIDLSLGENPLILIGASVRAAAQSANRAGFDVFGIDFFGDVDAQDACRWFASLEQIDQLSDDQLAELLSKSTRNTIQLDSAGDSDPSSMRLRGIPVMVVGGDQGLRIEEKIPDKIQSNSLLGFSSPNDADDLAWMGETVLGRVLRRLKPFTSRIGSDEAISRQLSSPPTLARIAIRSRTLFPPYRMNEAAASSGDSARAATDGPTSESVPTGESVAAKPHDTRSDLPGRWLTKRRLSSGGLGVTWSSSATSDDPKGSGASDSTIDVAELRQLWRPGRNYGVTFLSDAEDVVVLGACRSMFTTKGPHRFVYAGSYGPLRLPQAIQNQLRLIGQQAAGQSGIRGVFNADVLIDDDQQVCLLEINARWSASMECVERSFVAATAQTRNELSLIKLAMDCEETRRTEMTQRRVDSMLADAPRFLKRIIYSRTSGTVDGRVLKEIQKSTGHGFSKIWVCDRPWDGSSIEAGDPLVSLVCQLPARKSLSWRKTKRLIASLQKAVV